ncbi:Transcriptional adapter ada2, partial [Gonapodya sp. JEL0774]
ITKPSESETHQRIEAIETRQFMYRSIPSSLNPSGLQSTEFGHGSVDTSLAHKSENLKDSVMYPVYVVEAVGGQPQVRMMHNPPLPTSRSYPIPTFAMHPATPSSPFYIPKPTTVPVTVTDFASGVTAPAEGPFTPPPSSPARSDFLPSPALTAASPEFRGVSLSPGHVMQQTGPSSHHARSSHFAPQHTAAPAYTTAPPTHHTTLRPTTPSDLAAASTLALLRSLPQPNLTHTRRPSILYSRPASPPHLTPEERQELARTPPRWYKARTPSIGGGMQVGTLLGMPGHGLVEPRDNRSPARTAMAVTSASPADLCSCPVCTSADQDSDSQPSTYSASSPPLSWDELDSADPKGITWSSLSRVPPSQSAQARKAVAPGPVVRKADKKRHSPYPAPLLPPLPSSIPTGPTQYQAPRATLLPHHPIHSQSHLPSQSPSPARHLSHAPSHSLPSTVPVATTTVVRPRASSFTSAGSSASPHMSHTHSPARSPAHHVRARGPTPDRSGAHGEDHKLRGSGLTHLVLPSDGSASSHAGTTATGGSGAHSEGILEIAKVENLGFEPAGLEDMAKFVPEEWCLKMGRKGVPNVSWKGAPLVIPATAPGFANLSPSEARLCSVLRIWPAQYLFMKSIVIGAKMAGKIVRKAEGKKWFRIDVNKTGRVWDWFGAVGWVGDGAYATSGGVPEAVKEEGMEVVKKEEAEDVVVE